MGWNGSGTFNRLFSWVADKAAAINITASRMDSDTNDIVGNGLGNCITRDGQGQPSANLPMNGFKHTGAAVGAASGEYAVLGLNIPIPAAATAGMALLANLGGNALVLAGPLTSSRNRLVNAAFLIDQRNEGASVTVTTGASPRQFITDQWTVGGTFAATVAAQTVAAPAGFIGATKALQVTISASSATVNNGDSLTVQQNIEGASLGDLQFGGSSAKALSVQAWMQSSVTGTFHVTLQNSAANRSFVQTVSLTANMPKLVTLANIAGDQAGTWLTGVGQVGLKLIVALEAGSTLQGTAGAWQASNIIATNAQTQLTTTNGATFQLGLAQLEIGPQNTPFDVRPFGADLAACQRYYWKSFPLGTKPATNAGVTGAVVGAQISGASTSGIIGWGLFPSTMQAAPSMTVYNPSAANNQARNTASGTDFSATSFGQVGINSFSVIATSPGTTGPGSGAIFHLTADAGL